MLNKPTFDCNKLGDFYDCGCADDEEEGNPTENSGKGDKVVEGKKQVDAGATDASPTVEITKEP
jgi:FAD-linked sulfhydryl oxidase